MKLHLAIILTALVAASCAESTERSPERQDPADASFLTTGKADDHSISEGSDLAIAVLELANTASYETLDGAVALTATTVDSIVAARDTQPFTTLADLDSVRYVGPHAFDQMVAYVQAEGLVSTTISIPSGFGAIEIHPAPGAQLPEAEFSEFRPENVTDLERDVWSTRVLVAQQRGPFDWNVVGGAAIGEPLLVAAGDYTVFLGASEMDVSVRDQEHVEVTAARIEVPHQSGCQPDAPCTYSAIQREEQTYDRYRRSNYVSGGSAFGTGIYVLPGRYAVNAQTSSGRSITGESSIWLSEGDVHSVRVGGFSGIRITGSPATLPTCAFGPLSGYAIVYDRFVRGERSRTNMVEYDFSDDHVFVTWAKGTRSRKVAVGETFWDGPGRYYIVTNGSSMAVDIGPGEVREVELGRIEVVDSKVLGGPGSYRMISATDVVEEDGRFIDKAYVATIGPHCSHGTGYNVVRGDEYKLEVRANTVHRRDELDVSGTVQVPGVARVGRVRIGTPTGAQYPVWQPAELPTYWAADTELSYSHSDIEVFDERYCEREAISDACEDRWYGPWGPIAYGETVNLPAGAFAFGLNGSFNTLVIREGETTNLPVGRVEVSDAFDGTFTVRWGDDDPLLGADIPTGYGIDLLPATYTVEVSHGDGFTQEFDVTVP